MNKMTNYANLLSGGAKQLEFALSLSDISKTFPGSWSPFGRKPAVTILTAINLNIPPGQVFALLGPNGAGKTTLIKIICGLIQPNNGSVYIMGSNVLNHGSLAQNSIGHCLESERSFYYRITGRENLEFFATLNNIPKKEGQDMIGELLEDMNLESIADKPFMHYSSGQKQKFNFLRALLKKPTIIILDEPTKSLDPHAAEEFWHTLINWMQKSEENTIFYSTHNMEEAERYSTAVAFLLQGKIQVQGTLSDLMSQFNKSSLRVIYQRLTT